MSKFVFTGAIAVRAYGTITVEAETLEAAKAKICATHFDMEAAFEPHSSGDDAFDWNYGKPAVYLDYVSEDRGAEIELNEDLPDPADGPDDNPFDPESPEGRAFEDGRIDATGQFAEACSILSDLRDGSNSEENNERIDRLLNGEFETVRAEGDKDQPGATVRPFRQSNGDPASGIVEALRIAESFISGFVGDEMQTGIELKLSTIRNALAKAEGRL